MKNKIRKSQAKFKVADVHGVYLFKVDYIKTGVTGLLQDFGPNARQQMEIRKVFLRVHRQ